MAAAAAPVRGTAVVVTVICQVGQWVKQVGPVGLVSNVPCSVSNLGTIQGSARPTHSCCLPCCKHPRPCTHLQILPLPLGRAKPWQNLQVLLTWQAGHVASTRVGSGAVCKGHMASFDNILDLRFWSSWGVHSKRR